MSNFELSITRFIDAPPDVVYRAYTERTEEWFAPRPWTTRIVEQDLRPGGRFAIEMSGPNGESHPGEGIFLEIVPDRKIVSSNVLTAGWQPKIGMDSDCDFPTLTIVTFEPEGSGTRYTARVRHWSEDAVKKHEDMGFEQGWSICAAQLAELAEAEAKQRAAA